MEGFLASVLPRIADTGGFGAITPKFFVPLQILLCSEKIAFKVWWTQKTFTPKIIFPPNLTTWLRIWFCQNCVCN